MEIDELHVKFKRFHFQTWKKYIVRAMYLSEILFCEKCRFKQLDMAFMMGNG